MSAFRRRPAAPTFDPIAFADKFSDALTAHVRAIVREELAAAHVASREEIQEAVRFGVREGMAAATRRVRES